MTAPTRVVVIDDNRPLLRAFEVTLSARGYLVTSATTCASGLAAVREHQPDVVILDLGLPDGDGVSLLPAIRADGSVQVIVLSARQDASDKVAALDAGADDYVTKPFNMEELLARLRAAMRRATPEPQQPRIVTEHFTIDLASKQVTDRTGMAVRLSPTQWGILEVLGREAGNLVSARVLLKEVWGPSYEKETHYLRIYMAQLRRKLEPEPSRPRYLLTEPGLGYRLSV